ncbi:MAG: glycerol-3-phosphate dehydrogenase, partial [Paracoccaceae bacterium]|nr:glycerol-3-phosphate dehydrogenase [Paracoccaceae bacterium]
SLTCSTPPSRNMALGLQLGQGIARSDCFEGRPVVVEGEMNAKSVTDLARSVNIAMPICETVRSILHDGADLGASFASLWARPIEAEPRTMDLSFVHPATDQDIATLAERIS